MRGVDGDSVRFLRDQVRPKAPGGYTLLSFSSFPLCRARKTTHEHQHELQHGWESKSKIFCLARKCFFSSSIVSRKGVAAA